LSELLRRGLHVHSFDRAPSPVPDHPNLTTFVGDICSTDDVARAVEGVDTIFHTAAIIDLMAARRPPRSTGAAVSPVNVEGTKNLVHAAQRAWVARFVYTASNSVVMGGQNIAAGDETLPYTDRFNDLYTETKVVAEKFVLGSNGEHGLLTCSIRPSGIWGRGDQTMFRKVFEIGVWPDTSRCWWAARDVKLDNSYVHNLVHGFILAARTPGPGGTAPGQAYFINDGEPINMFEFSRRWCRPADSPGPPCASGQAGARGNDGVAVPALPLRLPKPLLEPLAIERITLDNYFSIDKARRDLGYEPLFTTEQALAECLPYYTELFAKMKAAAGEPVPARV
jgi:3beta-hydroxy-delta5-steroid dehydrogenase/steroid delta-isomerase